MTLGPWTLLERKSLLQTPIFRIFADRYRSPRTGKDAVLSVVDTADWVNIVALDRDENVILIRQFRPGTAQLTLEVPGGMVDPGEDPRVSAERELREETGYRAERIIDLGFVHPNPAIFSNKAHIFLCEGCELEGALELDDGEDIEVVPTPLSEVMRLVHDGSITHALVAVALSRFVLHREGKLRPQNTTP